VYRLKFGLFLRIGQKQIRKMAPKGPDKVAREMTDKLSNTFIVLDANDLNVDILGKPSKKT